MGYSTQLKCLEPLIALVNLFCLSCDSDHFIRKRTKLFVLQSQCKCLEPLITVINLFLLGYGSDKVIRRTHMAYNPKLTCLEPLIAAVSLTLLGYDSDNFILERIQKYGLESPSKMLRTSHCSCQFVFSRL